MGPLRFIFFRLSSDFDHMDNEYLTDIETLAGLIGQSGIVLIDTRTPAEYAEGHLPGARNIHEIFTYLSTEENGGYESMRQRFAALFGAAGVCGEERVIVYEDALDNGYGRSCRGWFILRHLGHRNVTILNGGYQAWLDRGLPVTTEVPWEDPKVFVDRPDHEIMLTAREMRIGLERPDVIKLDCRDHVEWVGTSSSPYGPDFAPRKGRIPGALWLEWYQTMHRKSGIYWFKSPDELRGVFSAEGITEESTVYLYCFKGARTSNVFIAMKMAGIANVRNYFASWNEWSRDPSLPIETGYPGRPQY